MIDHLLGMKWEDAPEGTTHVLYGVWCKIDVNDVACWDRVQDTWCPYGAGWTAEKFIKSFKPEHKPIAPPIVEQPQPVGQVVRINGVEVNWAEAPADATHVYIVTGEFRGWRKIEDDRVHTWVDGAWEDRRLLKHQYLEVNKGLVFERPGVGFIAPKIEPKPAPKKPIGWWT